MVGGPGTGVDGTDALPGLAVGGVVTRTLGSDSSRFLDEQ